MPLYNINTYCMFCITCDTGDMSKYPSSLGSRCWSSLVSRCWSSTTSSGASGFITLPFREESPLPISVWQFDDLLDLSAVLVEEVVTEAGVVKTAEADSDENARMSRYNSDVLVSTVAKSGV